MLDPASNYYQIDETLNGRTDYRFSNPDFNFKQFRSNLVTRWEYKPGSILYLVWQHSRTDSDRDPDYSLMRYFGSLWDVYPANIIMFKLSYWFSL